MSRKNRLGAAGALVVLLAGCATGGTSDGQPVILAEAQGICPTQTVYMSMPPQCRFARDWNGTTHSFRTPRRQWGVAYAFNCGSRPRDFTFDARLPAMDHMGISGPILHAKQGKGYVTFSRQKMLDMLQGVPPELKVDGNEIAVVLATACTWHVKAVLGTKTDVAAAVPPIPRARTPWWKKHTRR